MTFPRTAVQDGRCVSRDSFSSVSLERKAKEEAVDSRQVPRLNFFWGFSCERAEAKLRAQTAAQQNFILVSATARREVKKGWMIKVRQDPGNLYQGH